MGKLPLKRPPIGKVPLNVTFIGPRAKGKDPLKGIGGRAPPLALNCGCGGNEPLWENGCGGKLPFIGIGMQGLGGGGACGARHSECLSCRRRVKARMHQMRWNQMGLLRSAHIWHAVSVYCR